MALRKTERQAEEILEEIRSLLVQSIELQSAGLKLDEERGVATDNLTAYAEMEAGLAKQRTGLSQERTGLVRAQTNFSTRSTELAEVRTDLSRERSELAAERTDLAALRTEFARGRNLLAVQRTEMAATRVTLAELRNRLANLRTMYSKVRIELARNRTQLAIIRTGAALVTFAIFLDKAFPTSDIWWNLFNAVMGIAGTIALALGLFFYFRTRKFVRHLDQRVEEQESEFPSLQMLYKH